MVSCITPCSRESDYDILYFNYRSQTYKDKQLVLVLDDGMALFPYPDDDIKVLHCPKGTSIGKKRNIAIKNSDGDIIAHFDSDDYYAPTWIDRCNKALDIDTRRCTGFSQALFRSEHERWMYEYKGSQPYVIGATMFYYRTCWLTNRFQDISEGEDTIFLSRVSRVMPMFYEDGLFYARITGNNTCSHKALGTMIKM